MHGTRKFPSSYHTTKEDNFGYRILSITPGTASQAQISCIRSFSIHRHKDWKKQSGNRRDTGTLEKKERKNKTCFFFPVFLFLFLYFTLFPTGSVVEGKCETQ